MSPILMEAALDMISFLASSEDEVVDQDAAVGLLEQVGARLRELSSPDRARFLELVAERARRAADEGDAARAAFLVALPEQLGLS